MDARIGRGRVQLLVAALNASAQSAARRELAFVKHAVSVSLADVAGWGVMLDLALKQTGGPLTTKERAWADTVLQRSGRAAAAAQGAEVVAA